DVKKDYDIILFDAPPLLIVSDAQILSNKCDGTLLIANTGSVEKEVIVKAKAILASSQANVLGVVLNNYVFPRHQQYYDYYSYDE
ncbi:MAG: CpsD/CapB family tyrosine-protein kinase, partial [Lysinibacillus sp.]